MWGGLQPDLPEAHDNEKKRIATSVVEICDLQTGRWERDGSRLLLRVATRPRTFPFRRDARYTSPVRCPRPLHLPLLLLLPTFFLPTFPLRGTSSHLHNTHRPVLLPCLLFLCQPVSSHPLSSKPRTSNSRPAYGARVLNSKTSRE